MELAPPERQAQIEVAAPWNGLIAGTLRAQAVFLGCGATWLLLRTFVFESYSLIEFALQSAVISLLTCLALLARLKAPSAGSQDGGSSEPSDINRRGDSSLLDYEPGYAPSRSPILRVRLLLCVGLVFGAVFCLEWWATHVARGMFVLRLRRGLDSVTLLAAALWALCLILCPPARRTELRTQSHAVRVVGNVAVLLVLIWVYPYTDPFALYVQWSGLYLPLVAAVCIWNLVAWLRGEAFVRDWINQLVCTALPKDLCVLRSADGSPARRGAVWLAVVCAGAIALRLPGLSWGLPPITVDKDFRPVHPDEKVTYEQAWRMFLGPEPVAFAWGGCGYFRIGMFAKDLATYFTDPILVPLPQIVMLRGLNIVAVAACVLVVYACGVTVFDRRAACLAAVLLAILPGYVVVSHVARPEVLLTLFCAVGLYAALRALSSPDAPQWLLLGGIAMGLAIATKLPGVCLAAPLLTATLLARPSRRALVGHMLSILLGTCLGYLVASFETLFFFDRFLDGLRLTWWLHGTHGAGSVMASAAGYLGPMSAYAWTIVGSILLWVGVAVAARKREALVIVSFVVTGYLLVIVQRTVNLRAIAHLSPGVALLVANLLTVAFRSGAAPRWLIRAALAAAAVGIVDMAQESAGHMAYLWLGRDGRTESGEWIESHIQPDLNIGITPLYHGEWASSPPLDEYSRSVVILPIGRGYDASRYLDKDLDYIVISDLNLPVAESNPSVAAFFAEVRDGSTYKLVEAFRSSFGGVRLAEWLGWPLPFDWLYTRQTFYIYGRASPRRLPPDAR